MDAGQEGGRDDGDGAARCAILHFAVAYSLDAPCTAFAPDALGRGCHQGLSWSLQAPALVLFFLALNGPRTRLRSSGGSLAAFS